MKCFLEGRRDESRGNIMFGKKTNVGEMVNSVLIGTAAIAYRPAHAKARVGVMFAINHDILGKHAGSCMENLLIGNLLNGRTTNQVI